MLEFHATAVETYVGEFNILIVHFDDEGGRYLQFQVPEELDDPRDFEPGYGSVGVEINDQLFSGSNCFSAAELERGRFRLVLARKAKLTERFGEVIVTFDLDDVAFAELRRGLERAFRDFPGFRAP